jgi:putative transposase
MLSRAIDAALEKHDWRLSAFVYMPEHVHLLLFPMPGAAKLEKVLRAIKRPYSYRIKQILMAHNSPLLGRLTIRQRPGVESFRFWQEGPGFDRNLWNAARVEQFIDYIHENPRMRGLCRRPEDWRWSSARWYSSNMTAIDTAWPKLTPIPAEFWL